MNKGFSLVELIVVIAIMAILVGVAVPVYTSYIGKANVAVDVQAVDNLEHACKIVSIEYAIDVNFEWENTTLTATISGTDKDKAILRLNEVLGINASSDAYTVTLKNNISEYATNGKYANEVKLPDDIDMDPATPEE